MENILHVFAVCNRCLAVATFEEKEDERTQIGDKIKMNKLEEKFCQK